MKYIKLFENWTPETANLQRVKITSPDNWGTFIMIGHLKEEGTDYYFIPEKNGFQWIQKGYHTPDYVASIKKRFDSLVGQKCQIIVGGEGQGRQASFGGENNWDTEVWIAKLQHGGIGLKFEFT